MFFFNVCCHRFEVFPITKSFYAKQHGQVFLDAITFLIIPLWMLCHAQTLDLRLLTSKYRSLNDVTRLDTYTNNDMFILLMAHPKGDCSAAMEEGGLRPSDEEVPGFAARGCVT